MGRVKWHRFGDAGGAHSGRTSGLSVDQKSQCLVLLGSRDPAVYLDICTCPPMSHLGYATEGMVALLTKERKLRCSAGSCGTMQRVTGFTVPLLLAPASRGVLYGRIVVFYPQLRIHWSSCLTLRNLCTKASSSDSSMPEPCIRAEEQSVGSPVPRGLPCLIFWSWESGLRMQ